ncbi:shikimate kinase [Roseibium sp. HPY-6]|uniref:shikimate kinase n=1 Tax=Roseibium sp. HPY-6 TaxID=3229852 RepID=UPI00338D92B6
MTENKKTQDVGTAFDDPKTEPVDLDRLTAALGRRSIVLVGIMGCGKSTVGKRLAHRLGLEFVDADSEIERAANMTVSEIFAAHGEPYFRSGEERVIARLLGEGPQVLATGGGAFMSETTRSEIAEQGLSVWLKVDFDTVMARVRRRATRPLLQNPDPEGTMRKLLAEREPVYAKATLTVTSKDIPHDAVVDQIVVAMAQYLFQGEDTFSSPSSFT